MFRSTATTAAATSTEAPANATAPSAPNVPDASPATGTTGTVPYEPEVGRFKPGSRPERLEPGQARWRRFPNHSGGSASVHPADTARHVREGLRFDDGRTARVAYVEREAFVDVIHFYFAA